MNTLTFRTIVAAMSLGAAALTAIPAQADPGNGRGHGQGDVRHGGKQDRSWRDNDRWNRPDRRPARVYRGYDWNRPDPYYGGYYADRYYRTGYRAIPVTRGTRIYRGYDDRYYCRRSDGTTGLIVGAALGGLLGNRLERGNSQVLTTILGAGAGAALGSSIDRGSVSCR